MEYLSCRAFAYADGEGKITGISVYIFFFCNKAIKGTLSLR